MKTLIDLSRNIILGHQILRFSHNVQIKLSNLMSIHTRSRHLDGTSPIEIVVTQIKGELLESFLRNRRFIQGNIEMSREDTSLSGELRNQVEIILILILLLHK